MKTTIPNINKHVVHFANVLVKWVIASFPKLIPDMIHNSQILIEKNPHILKYSDITLFDHQKQLFQIFGKTVNSETINRKTPKLVLYIAPTGTGKTLSPLGLSQTYRILFVCTARHVGLALARSAISMEKRVAFAFGCETASDIRLHYFAAIDYTKNYKTGAIRKVDNSIGHKVEIMICDIKSYLTAMHYMLAFNEDTDIITFWDEPTITMDYENHDLHETIHRNWSQNLISKVVLSCATLPQETEIQDTITDFRVRFDGAEIHTISTHDCKKTISLLNKSGMCVLPHLLFEDLDELHRCAEHCEEIKSLLRYFDLGEIVRFVEYVNHHNYIDEMYLIENYFESIEEINMDKIKKYYLAILKHLKAEHWPDIYNYLKSTQLPMFTKPHTTDALRKIKSEDHIYDSKNIIVGGGALVRTSSVQVLSSASMTSIVDPTSSSSSVKTLTNPFAGILVTTEDAYTLTDGPTIYLAENIDNIGKFYIMQSKIPTKVYESVMEKIERNNLVQQKMDELDKQIAENEMVLELDFKKMDGKTGGGGGGSKGGKVDHRQQEKTCMQGFDGGGGGSVSTQNSKKSSGGSESAKKDKLLRNSKELAEQINGLRTLIQVANIDSMYIPNTLQHQKVWVHGDKRVANAFVPNIDDDSIRDIMSLNVSSQDKLILLLGIGMLKNNPNIQYMEIMKRLATNQQLFMIIAASDYIYGTNYQFCHGFIGKDIVNMTQQKTIQALGRIGRGNIQQNYTVRFRDDTIIRQLFLPAERNLEGEIMSRLMSGAAEWAEENPELLEDLNAGELEDNQEDQDQGIQKLKVHPKYARYQLAVAK